MKFSPRTKVRLAFVETFVPRDATERKEKAAAASFIYYRLRGNRSLSMVGKWREKDTATKEAVLFDTR